MPIALHLRADTGTARVGVFEVPYPLILLHLRADTRTARGVVGVVHVTGRAQVPGCAPRCRECVGTIYIKL